jgi:hypothetical protein
MPETILVVVLAVLSLFGVGLGLTGLARRSWGLVLVGAIFASMPVGFATVVVSAVPW